MNKHVLSPIKGALTRGLIPIFCKLTTTTGGTLSTVAGANGGAGTLTLVKTAAKTGRYKWTLDGNYGPFVAVDVEIEGLADAATSSNKAIGWKTRNKVQSGTNQSLEIQFVGGTNGLADAELEDGCGATITLWCRDAT